jgi:1-pyrroline-5-carboxylate dehydrogenase
LKSSPVHVVEAFSLRHSDIYRTLGTQVKLEDAGFDWKILGPDADKADVDNVAYVCDQDAYACSGQKCSAQSILFVHENWKNTGTKPAGPT